MKFIAIKDVNIYDTWKKAYDLLEAAARENNNNKKN